MTLREWVEAAADVVAPRADLEAFETGLLEGWMDAAEHGLPMTLNVAADPEIWGTSFAVWRLFSKI